jgi:hypothetical protein
MSFLRWLLNSPPTNRFDPSLVVAYHGSYIRGNRVIHSDVTAHLANGRQVDLTEDELENLIQDDLYFIGEHPVLEAMRKRR